MKLSSEPKPVKVRITSGGIEHSTLASLLKCFKWEDLEKNEEQVRRWLRRQGKDGINIASQWKDGQKANNAAGLFEIYKIFFDLRKKGVYSIDVLFDRWSKDQDGKTDNFKFLQQSLLSLGYKKATEYAQKNSGNTLNPIEMTKNNTLAQTKATIENTKRRDSNPLGKTPSSKPTLDIRQMPGNFEQWITGNDPVGSKPTLDIRQAPGSKTENSDRDLLEVRKIAESYIQRPLTHGIVEEAKGEFGLKYLVDLTTRKDKIAAFFIALLIQRFNNNGNDYYHQHSYNLTGIACCEKYNYMAQLLIKGGKFYNMTKTLKHCNFPQKVNEIFMSKPEIINWYAEMDSYHLEMLWKFFCENINILEIK